MKVIAINGSHRKGQNTSTMLKLVMEPIEKAKIDTELIELVDFNIKICKACNKCLIRPECSIKDDDMEIIASKMFEADGIIIGSPVYFGNVTSILKIFIDRTRWMHMCRNMLHGKVGGVVTHAGLRNGGQEFTHMILERFLSSHGIKVVDARDQKKGIYNLGAMGSMYDLIFNGKIKWKKGVLLDELAVMMCRMLGENLVKELRKF